MIVRDSLKIGACVIATAGMTGISEAAVIDRWDFNDAAGTTLNSAVNSGPGGASFGGTPLATDGAGSLVYDSTTGDQFPLATGSVSATSGVYELEFHLSSMTYDDNAVDGVNNGGNDLSRINAGFTIRDQGNSSNIAPILFSHNGPQNGIRIVSFNSEGFFQLFDYGAVTSIDNVTVRAVYTINGASTGTIDVFVTDDDVDLGAGIGTEAFVGTITTPANATFDSIAAFKNFYDAGESASIDYLELSLVPEPGSMALVALGTGLVLIRRRATGT